MVKYIVRKLDYGYLTGIKKKILYPDQFLTLKRSANKKSLKFKNKFKLFLWKSKYNSYQNIYKSFNITKIKEYHINLIPNLYLKEHKLNKNIVNLKKHSKFTLTSNKQLDKNFFTNIIGSQKFLFDLFELYFILKFYFHEKLRNLIIKRFNKKFRKKFKFVKKNLKFNLNKTIKFIDINNHRQNKVHKNSLLKEQKNDKYRTLKKKRYIHMNYVIKYIKNFISKNLAKYKRNRKNLKFFRKIVKCLVKSKKSPVEKNKYFFNYFDFVKYNEIKFKNYLNKPKRLMNIRFKRNLKIPLIKIIYSLYKIQSIKLNFYSSKLLIYINKYLKNSKDNLKLDNLNYDNIIKFLALKKKFLWFKFFLNFLYFFFFKYYNFRILSNKKKTVKKHYKLNLNFFNLERFDKKKNIHLFETQNSFFFFRFLRMSKKLLDLFKPIKNFFFKNTNKIIFVEKKLICYKISNFFFKNIKLKKNNYLNFLILNIYTNIFNIKKVIYIKFLNFLLYMAVLNHALYFKKILK